MEWDRGNENQFEGENSKLVELKITELFIKGIDLLGNPEITVRLGGMYALEQIAQNSPTYYWQVMQVLSNYIREKSRQSNTDKQNSPKFTSVRVDIQTALKIIVKRRTALDPIDTNLDLSNSNLIGADLQSADLSSANLIGIELDGADLSGANLELADLERAYLIGTNLSNVNLRGANLIGAHLSNANLSYANLSAAYLSGVDLEAANLVGANLTGANLIDANLSGANLNGTNLNGAKLIGAYLFGTKLVNVNLQGANLKEAKLDGTRIDDNTTVSVEQILQANDWQHAVYSDRLQQNLPLPKVDRD